MSHYERLKRSTIEHKNYTVVEGKTEKDILKEMRTEYEKRELKHIGPWNNKGTLPTTYVNPKEKDTINKERTISSYYKVPMRIVYKRTQKVLTWLLRTLPENYRHFTLHKIGDIKDRTAHIKEELQNTYGTDTEIIPFSSDVTAMYTHLCQTEIRRAIRWLINIHKEQKQYRTTGKKRTPRKINKNIMTLNVEEDTIEWGRGNHDGEKKSSGTKRDIITLSFDDIIRVVDMDLKFTHSKVGKTILKQKKGCPIGGILSGSYANIYCAKNEYDFLNEIGQTDINKRVQGIRQMDDLILWVSYNKKEEKTKEQAAQILNKLYNYETQETKVYTGGLNLEMQEIKYNKRRKTFKIDFAGTRIHGTTDTKTLYTTTLNKNIKHIRKYGTQKYTRYPHKETYIHDNVKRGVIIGNVMRTRTQNTHEENLIKAIQEDIEELECIGYTTEEIKGTLNTLKKKEDWRGILKQVWNTKKHKQNIRHNLQ